MLQTLEQSVSAFQTHSRSENSLEAQVGNTPLLRLENIEREADLAPDVALYGKAEWFNPSGSVKDRAALNIIRSAEWTGELRAGMILLDSTSGNMGIAYAMLGAARGYEVKLAIPSNASPERIAVLQAYGADLELTDPLEGSDGAMRVARRMAEENPDFFYANQYNNPANWQAHYHTTANEIWSQTEGKITHFVAGLGTSGTFVGATRRLKELKPDVQAIAMQPDSPFNGLEGLKHLPTAIRPGIYDESLPDDLYTVRTEDAYEMARLLARREGLFLGVSAAGAVAASVEVARTLQQGVVVTVLPDNGYKYLSERFWKE
ncbi:MAG TPA: cysteine synthase family protein [Candidatus Sulfomarinibacteraceae bacterium]|nr:cysteine synthase family protein [Candidatus Sulfomarinibacteraceae bacterium]